MCRCLAQFLIIDSVQPGVLRRSTAMIWLPSKEARMTTCRPCLVATLFLFACFNPDPSKRTVRCDAENPCPDSMVCASGLCTSETTDGGRSDQSLPDLTPIGPPGCADNGGTYLGAAWACPGLFGGTSPTASKRCATGFVPCSTATGISLTSCAALPGFFIANYIGKASGNSVSCTAAGGGSRGIFGCGRGGTQQAACMGFVEALVCSSSPDWQCADQIDLVRNNSLGNGVLCCKQ